MKRVLIISYNFPPHQSIGSQRPYRLAKYFPKFGWEPIVLTAKHPGKSPEGIRVIETDYKDTSGALKSKFGFKTDKGMHEQLGITVSKRLYGLTWKSKIIKLLKEFINYPDSNRGWYKFAIESTSELLSKEKVDAIISTSPPATSHLIARELHNRFKVPWIADLRDLWTQNIGYRKYGLIHFFERRLEIKTLSDTDALVTVTKPWVDILRSLHKDKKVVCITNGYDTEDFLKAPSRFTDKFTITYTGHLYNGIRDPSLLFEVIANLIKSNRINRDLVEIRFYSPEEEWLIDEIKKNNLEGVVIIYGFLPRLDVLERQRESQLLLILQDNNIEKTLYPAKIFEYFGAKRPVIATGGGGSIVEDLLNKTNAGKFAENYDMLEYILLKYYQEFIKFGQVKWCGNDNIENYTYNSITRKYSEILKMLPAK